MLTSVAASPVRFFIKSFDPYLSENQYVYHQKDSLIAIPGDTRALLGDWQKDNTIKVGEKYIGMKNNLFVLGPKKSAVHFPSANPNGKSVFLMKTSDGPYRKTFDQYNRSIKGYNIGSIPGDKLLKYGETKIELVAERTTYGRF